MGSYKDKHGYSRFSHWLGLDGRSLSDAIESLTSKGELGNQISSFINQTTGGHLTGAEKEANELSMQNQEDIFQRQVSGMQKAGLNPALMYDSGSMSAPDASSSVAGGMSDIMSAITLPLQLKMMKSDIALKQSEADVNRSQAASIDVNTDFNKRTFDLRTEALELSNNLSREQKDLVYARKEEAVASMKKLQEEAKTEESRRELNFAQSTLAKMEASEIVQLMPYKIALSEAQSDSQRAQAALYAAQTLYQNKLISSGYIESLCSQLESQASSAESKAVVDGITARLRSGRALDPADFGDSKVANFLEGVWNGVFTESVNNGVAGITNLLQYMPSVLLGAGATPVPTRTVVQGFK